VGVDVNISILYGKYQREKDNLRKEYLKSLDELKRDLVLEFHEYLKDNTTQDLTSELGMKNLNFIYECLNLYRRSNEAEAEVRKPKGRSVKIGKQTYEIPEDGNIPEEWAELPPEIQLQLMEEMGL